MNNKDKVVCVESASDLFPAKSVIDGDGPLNVFTKNGFVLLVEPELLTNPYGYFGRLIIDDAVLRLSRIDLSDIAEIISEALKNDPSEE